MLYITRIQKEKKMAFKTKFDGQTDTTITLGKEGSPKSIEGYFLGSKETPDKGFGPGKLHFFQTAEGVVGVWGKTKLNILLTSDLIGQMVRATFTGMVQPTKKGRRPSYGFRVEHDSDNTIDTSNINLNAEPSTAVDEDESPTNEYINEEDADLEEEIPYKAPKAPMVKAQAPSAEKQAKVQALMNARR